MKDFEEAYPPECIEESILLLTLSPIIESFTILKITSTARYAQDARHAKIL